ncbi:hypothetical protein F5Y09DRAFT_117729 [Xylaria sp. FL1042]|nr:hypothetical protein F5Y09DRAFT_117729 [Xylaria sp. FL1042]
MAAELRRPLTRKGSSGSRPPTSRFQEGSMNDRISAAPPAQFMGPEQLREYEHQFYTEPPTPREARRPRPFSAAAVYQHGSADEPQQQMQQQEQPRDEQRPAISHKKSTSFFGRVRDALFHRGGAVGGGQHGQSLKQQEVRRKHSSLQEPLHHHHPLPPPPPRPDYHTGRTQSEINIAQIFPNNPRGGDRPSREDVLASYNQLVASGFFQSHAIQSSRHAAPSSSSAPASGGRQTPVLPMDPPPAPPRGPIRIPSFRKTSRSGSTSRMSSSQNRNSREYAAATMAAPVAPRSSLSSLFRPSIPDLNTKDSWLTLRGRKRTRGDDSETTTPEPQQSSSSTATGSGGYFAQPLKRVAKKLREMPSSSSQLNAEAKNARNAQNVIPPTTQDQSNRQAAAGAGAADGVMRLVPSVSCGGTVHPNERPIRLRSPSPERPLPRDNERERRSGRPPIAERASSRTRPPRKTFSYTLAEPSRGRTRTMDGERERERERDRGMERERERERDKYRVQRRGSSSTRRSDGNGRIRKSRTTTPQPQPQPQPQNPLGQWQRVSLEDTMIHRDSVDSWRDERDDKEQTTTTTTATTTTSTSTHPKTRGRTTTPTPSPLQTMADANTRSASKAPERWHGTGKAYHLKDRGSRPDLALRRSEDSAKVERDSRYGKENNNNNNNGVEADDDDDDVDWRRVDADGDVDVLVHEKWGRGPRESYHHRGRARAEEHQQQQQWHIGNAL